MELLPSPIAPLLYDDVRRACPGTPLIAGGFITTTDELARVFDAGFSAVTSSTKSLW